MMLGKKLRKLREERHLTSEQVADLLNVSSAYIRQVELSKAVPSLRLFIDLCRLYHVSSDFLLNDDIDIVTLYKESSLGLEIEESLLTLTPKEIEILKYIIFGIIKAFKEKDKEDSVN